MFNLLTDAWLPARRQRSGGCVIRPAQLAPAPDDDPVIALDWPRADFRIASLEFLIGLLATFCPPADHDAWINWWETPPSPDMLDAAFAPFAHAFALDGDGPRFLQDFDELVAEQEPVERLLIEAPGEKTAAENTDLLVRRGRVTRVGRPAAAIALYTLQSWAPGGGSGHRVGLRGGGPLTTLVLPHEPRSLWHVLWANVPCRTPPTQIDLPRVLPWLAPTRTSEGAHVVTPQNAHPLQCWWGMPRRIRLDFSPGGAPAPCDLTGAPDTVQVIGWRQRKHGPKYVAWGDTHPLTATYRPKGKPEILPVHPQSDGIGYRHWRGLVVASDNGFPARAVSDWRGTRLRDAGNGGEYDRTRLLAAGFDIYNNNKVRAFIESEMPLPALADGDAQDRLDTLSHALVKAAELVAGLLSGAVRAALFRPKSKVAHSELLATVSERFWEATEATFFGILHQAAQRGATEPHLECAAWLERLRKSAREIFDNAAPVTADSGGAAPRIGRARRELRLALLGYGRNGEALFSGLGQSPPRAKSRKTRSA